MLYAVLRFPRGNPLFLSPDICRMVVPKRIYICLRQSTKSCAAQVGNIAGLHGFGIPCTFPTCAVHDLVYYLRHIYIRPITDWDGETQKDMMLLKCWIVVIRDCIRIYRGVRHGNFIPSNNSHAVPPKTCTATNTWTSTIVKLFLFTLESGTYLYHWILC